MKQLVNALLYMVISVIVILITILVINNIEPINHTHDKELEKKLIDTKWVTQKYYNDEFIDVLLIFNKDNTITFKYIHNNKPADLYYSVCNKWKWSKSDKTLDIECENKNYTTSTIKIISITNKSLKIKTYNEYLSFKKN